MTEDIKARAKRELLRRAARAELERRQQRPAEGKTDAEPEPMSAGGYALDTLKGFGAGFGRGVVGMAGAMGDVQQMVGNAAGGVAGWFGATPAEQDAMRNGVSFPGTAGRAPQSENIKATVDPNHALEYDPKSTAGEYARTIGEFAPAAVAPGGLARKAAMAVVPGATSETAGQLSEGSAAEPYARIAGALVGGVGAAGRMGGAAKQMRANAPTHERVDAVKDATYAQLDNAGIVYDPNEYKSFAMKTMMALRKHGLLPEDHGVIAADLRDILKRTKKVNGWTELDTLRKRVGNLPKTASDTDIARALIIKSHLDDLIENGRVVSVKGLQEHEITPLIKQARELARRDILAKQIQEMQRKSEHYVSGEESGLRNQFSTYMRSGRGKGLTPAEKKAFGKVERREGVKNVLTSTGSRIGQLLLGGAGFAGGGIPGALGMMGAHLGARKISEAMTKKSVRDALATVLAGRSAQEVARSADATTQQRIAARLLLLGPSSVSSATNQ